MNKMNRTEIEGFTNKYFPTYKNDIRRISYVIYEHYIDFLINEHYIYKIKKSKT